MIVAVLVVTVLIEVVVPAEPQPTNTTSSDKIASRALLHIVRSPLDSALASADNGLEGRIGLPPVRSIDTSRTFYGPFIPR